MKTEYSYIVFFVIQRAAKKDEYGKMKVGLEFEMNGETAEKEIGHIRNKIQNHHPTGQVSITGIIGPFDFKIVDDQTPA